MKKLILLLLLALAWTGCCDGSSCLADFNRPVYTPEYASGFDIQDAGHRYESMAGYVRETTVGEPGHSILCFV